MPSNQFLPFATGGGANTLTPAGWAALASLLANGFQAGTASSAQINTVLRQTSTVAAAVAKFIEGQGYDALDNGDHAALAVALRSAVSVASTPSGAVAAFARSSAPSGWLKANGAAVSRTTYDSLFAAIGTTFGAGDGSTTFNLPDLRGEFVRGWDDGRGIDPGRAFASGQASANKAHSHMTTIASNIGTSNARNDPPWYTDSDRAPDRFRAWASSTDGDTESRPRNVALLFCIKF